MKDPVALVPLLELPSGVCVRPDKIMFVARKELGQFMLVMEGVGIAPTIDSKDLDILKALGVIQRPAEEAKANGKALIES